MSQPTQAQQTQAIQSVESNASNALLKPVSDAFFSPLGLMILAVGAWWGWYALKGDGSSKGTLARGKLASDKHRKAAREKGFKLIQARKHNEVCLYIGQPKGYSCVKQPSGKWLIRYPYPIDPKRLYIPGAEAHIAVVGATGSGKSFSGINPMVRSAVDQGFPIIYFDLKYSADDPNPTSGIAGYAKEVGYRVSVFAPGKKESCRCNPLDLLKDEFDAETARQFAMVLHKNFTPQGSHDSPFFTQNAQKMIQGVMMLAKRCKQYPDLMTARAIARMPDLIKRLELSELPEVIKAVFDSLVSSAGAPETLAGIQSTVSNMLGNLMTPNVLPALTGETTMPLDLDGRQLLSFGVDGERRDVVLPMIATILHLVVNRNIQRPRKTPLVLVLDEVPSIYLPALADWLNQARSAGLCVILGFQSFSLLEKLYGRTGAEEIVTGCTTQLIFQLNDLQTARNYSELLGKEDIKYSSHSSSRGRGGGSSSRAQQLQTRALLEPNEIVTFPQGKCILLNRGYGDGKSARVPYLAQIEIPKIDIEAVSRSQKQWPKIQEELIAMSDLNVPSDGEFTVRNEAAKKIFGDPKLVKNAEKEEKRSDFLDIEDDMDLSEAKVSPKAVGF